MRALLIQHGCKAALEVLPENMEAQTKAALNKKAHSAVILCLAGRKIFEHIDEFNKIVLDLANIKVKFEDEDLALLLLTSLPASYEHFVDTFLYGREALTLEDDHLKRNCLKNNCKKSTDYVKKDEQPSSSGSTYDDYEMMMVMSAQAHALLDWIMDSGCSYHMTPRYIPELKRNLTSLGPLEKEGFTIKLQSGKVKMNNGSRRGGTTGAGKARAVWQEKSREARFLKELCSRKVTSSQFQCRKAHYSGSDRLCSFRLMGFKHKAFGKFKEWKQLVKNQTGRMVKKLRTNNDLEFCNQEFEQLCIESEIARHLTVAEMPQQNGLAERMNRTLMDKICCLLIQSGLPKTFWAEAKCTVAYLINRSPSIAIEKKTHMKMWSGHPSDYGMLRIFGCAAYPHDKHVEEEDTHEPLTYQEAVTYEDSSKWKAAMKEDMDSLRKNKTWELVDHLFGQKMVSCKWLFKIKKGIEVRHTSIRVILVLIACKDYELEQLDVKTTFLHGNLKEVIYMRQPPGYEQGNKVEIRSTKSLLKKEFGMKVLGEAKKILGMEIVKDQSRKILRESQFGYISKILNNFRIDNGKSVKMPLGGLFKLSLKDCPIKDCDVKRMSRVSYANAVGSLIGGVYLMKAVKEAIWLRGLLEELAVDLNTVAVNCDNQDAIHLTQNHVSYKRTKRINVRYYFITKILEAKTVKVLNVGTEHNTVDALTKVAVMISYVEKYGGGMGYVDNSKPSLLIVPIPNNGWKPKPNTHKYTPRHKCSGQLYSLVVLANEEEEYFKEEEGDEDHEKEVEGVSHAELLMLIVFSNTGLQLMSMQEESQSLPKELQKVVDRYTDVFAIPKELPPHRSYDHMILLIKGTQPVNIRPYRHPPIQKDATEAIVKELLEAGVIKASNSPFASPIVMVKKKDNTWRMDGNGQEKAHKPRVPHRDGREDFRSRVGSSSATKGHPIAYLSLENGAVDALSRLGSGNELLSMFVSSITTDLIQKVQATWVSNVDASAIVTFLQADQTKKTLCLACHPQTDGQTEVVNRYLEGYLRCMIGEQSKKWFEWLPLAELWYNTNFSTSINTTPFEVVYGQTPPIHVSYLGGLSKVGAVERTPLAREGVIQVLKFHLQRSQNKVKQQVESQGLSRNLI
nr:retrovirus-related Pol polyprotein from transposon TNT 1-94 [Tanacetum cinerariifolium]